MIHVSIVRIHNINIGWVHVKKGSILLRRDAGLRQLYQLQLSVCQWACPDLVITFADDLPDFKDCTIGFEVLFCNAEGTSQENNIALIVRTGPELFRYLLNQLRPALVLDFRRLRVLPGPLLQRPAVSLDRLLGEVTVLFGSVTDQQRRAQEGL